MHISATTKYLWLLMMVRVGSFQEGLCRRKEPLPGVQVLAPGGIVTLSCSGQITVDGVGVTLTTASQAGRDGEELARTRDAVSVGGSYGDITTSRSPPSTALGVELKGKDSSAVTVSRNWPSGDATTSEKDATMFQEATSVEVGDVSRTKVRAPRQARWPVKDSRSRVHWKLDGRPMRVTGEEVDTLHLGPFFASKSGNYSCHQGSKMIFSVKIMVEAPPEQPSLSCYQKSPTSHIRCEWQASQPVTPTPLCHLLLKKGLLDQTTVKPCSYSKLQNRCWCVLDKKTEGSRDSYWASLCVYNTAGHVTSPPVALHPQDVVKPDPPYNVSVHSQEGKKHWLIVSWKYPRSWKGNFYKLTFQLQYFVVLQGNPRGMQEVHTPKLNYTIKDATPRVKYLLRVRGREEFGIGHWSDWSPQLYAYTWTEPTTMPASTDTVHDSWFPEGSGIDEDNAVGRVFVPHTPDSQLLLHVSWVIGVCMLLGLIVMSAFALRHKVKFIFKPHKLSGTSPPLPSASASSASPTEEGNPLVRGERPGPPQNSDPPFPEEDEASAEGIHLSNLGYFLVQRD
ncbi:interleukin-6 receptor subunit alpha [Brienomyrus brachyistius]|uniref:interleukin-6 receptor subunit alpha n=1 Tax=Brienomyrus brachyistius TaxID=42636 RepID=UPI0020B28502|nr:interleukin-6 receptor subunit alpha [Brienomyrus brachyistius]